MAWSSPASNWPRVSWRRQTSMAKVRSSSQAVATQPKGNGVHEHLPEVSTVHKVILKRAPIILELKRNDIAPRTATTGASVFAPPCSRLSGFIQDSLSPLPPDTQPPSTG